MKRHPFVYIILMIFGLALSACNLPTSANQATADLYATLAATAGVPVVTGAPTTVAVPGNTNTPLPNPTSPPTASDTAVPTAVPATSTPVPTVGSSQSGGGVPVTTCKYLATFVADVTIPDDSYINPGAGFTKVWRVRNDGTCTWGPGYPLNSLVFYGGSQLSAPNQVPLAGVVGPGQMIDISVNMVAPNTAGIYTSQWMFWLSNAYFGLGPSQSAVLYTRIIVGATAIPTPSVISTRVYLPNGATATSVTGSIAGAGTRYYLLTAGKDQMLMATITSMNSDLALAILDASNMQVLVNGDSSVQALLPHSGDYYIRIKDTGSAGADFVLGVTIPARITFAPGGISATVSGKIVDHFNTSYLLRALAGQTMTVTVTAPTGDIGLTIYGVSDGQPLVRAESGATNWSGTLPATQDYMIMVVPAVELDHLYVNGYRPIILTKHKRFKQNAWFPRHFV